MNFQIHTLFVYIKCTSNMAAWFYAQFNAVTLPPRIPGNRFARLLSIHCKQAYSAKCRAHKQYGKSVNGFACNLNFHSDILASCGCAYCSHRDCILKGETLAAASTISHHRPQWHYTILLVTVKAVYSHAESVERGCTGDRRVGRGEVSWAP